jgi:hypothetical protein
MLRNDILRTTCELGWEIWKKWNGYHRRSLVEDKMRCFKLLGERVMVRYFNRQVAELRVRVACCTATLDRIGRLRLQCCKTIYNGVSSVCPDLLNKIVTCGKLSYCRKLPWIRAIRFCGKLSSNLDQRNRA